MVSEEATRISDEHIARHDPVLLLDSGPGRQNGIHFGTYSAWPAYPLVSAKMAEASADTPTLYRAFLSVVRSIGMLDHQILFCRIEPVNKRWLMRSHSSPITNFHRLPR